MRLLVSDTYFTTPLPSYNGLFLASITHVPRVVTLTQRAERLGLTLGIENLLPPHNQSLPTCLYWASYKEVYDCVGTHCDMVCNAFAQFYARNV